MASRSFSTSSRAEDVQFALQRAKKKISNLQQQLSNKSDRKTSSEDPVDTSPSTWMPSKELRESLVDMYTANPRVNEELRQRLPSPKKQQMSSPDRSGISLSLEQTDRPQAPQLLQELLTSCSSSSPETHKRSVSLVSPSFRPPGGLGRMEMDLSPSRGPSPWAESCGEGPDGGRASRGPCSPALRRHQVSTDNSSHRDDVSSPVTAAARAPSLDRDKNISFLLKELDALRDANKKLLDQLVQKEKELQQRELEEELLEEQREAQAWERPAEVLEEVLAAQKDRDQALMSRLLLANEERDEAVLRARQLQQASDRTTNMMKFTCDFITRLDEFHLEDSDKDVDELLQCVCDAESVREVQQFGSVLVQRLRLARQRRNDITAEEMKAVMEERDGSLAKCKRLEQDLIEEKEQRATKEELLRLQRGGGRVLEDRHELEAELQLLQANHSSQDLLAPPSSLSSDDASPAGSLMAAHQAPPTLVQVQRLWKEKRTMEAELQRCQEAEREASERVRRLERLVEVLRKKVGTGSLRAVI